MVATLMFPSVFCSCFKLNINENHIIYDYYILYIIIYYI